MANHDLTPFPKSDLIQRIDCSEDGPCILGEIESDVSSEEGKVASGNDVMFQPRDYLLPIPSTKKRLPEVKDKTSRKKSKPSISKPKVKAKGVVKKSKAKPKKKIIKKAKK